jgi:hypothetical protein
LGGSYCGTRGDDLVTCSEHPITFDERDQPEHSIDVGRFPLVVSAVLETVRATKIFMDGGRDSNLIYWDTFEKLRIDTDKLRPTRGPITGIVPGRQVMPLGVIDLRVTFGDVANYRKEILSFEVVDFQDTYHVMLGIPCFVKFMVVPHYAYLKTKMPGPNGIITISRDHQNAYQCDLLAIENAARNLDPSTARDGLCPHAKA